MTAEQTARLRTTVTTALGLTVGGVAYFLTLFNYSHNLTRTALAPGFLSGFFDQQGRTFLDGSIALPDGALGIEGFVHDGQTFMYFPPFPAILRLPVLMTTHEYDGKLTALSMAVAWIVFAVMVTKLVWLLHRLLVTTEPPTWLSCAVIGLFLAGATGGTVLTYDAALPWVYHEVYVWAATACVGGLYWMIRVAEEPTTDAIRWLGIFALVAVGTRSTAGWAICLVVIVMALLLRFRDHLPERRRMWRWVLLAGLLPLAAGIALNLYKFDHVYMFPLQDQVWTTLNQQRRDALAANGGTLTGPQFFTTSFMAYLRPDGIRFVDYFPWITLPAHPAPSYNGAFVDQTYRTGSVTAFMPLFMLMLFVAVVAAFRPRVSPELRWLRAPLVSSVLVTGAVMSYGYYSFRYASEFVPALVLGGAIGTVLLCRLLDRRPRLAFPAVALVGVGMVFSIVAQMAVGLASTAYIHRGQPLEEYIALQHRFSPDQQAERIGLSDGLPTGGNTDDLAISGDCDALYLNTGDKYEPWIPVEERARLLVFTFSGKVRTGLATVVDVSGNVERHVDLEVSQSKRVRFVVTDDQNRRRGPWFDLPADGTFRLGVRNLTDYGYFEFASNPGRVVGYLPSVYFDDNWDSHPAQLTIEPDEELVRLGLEYREEPGIPLALCHELADTAGLTLPAS